MNNITAIVLASGFSKRMGCNKLLLESQGRPMIAHIFDVLEPSRFQEVLVVTSYGEIAAMAEAHSYRVIHNDAPEMGQSRSVVLGVTASPNTEGWLFFNGDMPWLRKDTVRQILTLAADAQNKIIVPRYGGNPGQPVYFPKYFYQKLLSLTGDGGGRAIIKSHPGHVLYLDIADRRQGIDIDTPEDYERYRKEAGQ